MLQLQSRIEHDGELHLRDLPYKSGEVLDIVIRSPQEQDLRTADFARLNAAEKLQQVDEILSRPVLPEDVEFWDDLAQRTSELRRRGTSRDTIFE